MTHTSNLPTSKSGKSGDAPQLPKQHPGKPADYCKTGYGKSAPTTGSVGNTMNRGKKG